MPPLRGWGVCLGAWDRGLKATATGRRRDAAGARRRLSCSRDYRVLFKYPLAVWLRVVERLSEVQVLHVRSTT